MSIDPRANDGKRTVFRVLALVCGLITVVLIVSAAVDFFSVMASDSMREPTKFWMFFLALPFFLATAVFGNLGFMGAAARYSATETAPVLKDTASYLTDGKGLFNIGATGAATPATGPYCRSCGTRNDPDAKFCDSCGTSMA